MVTTLTNEEKLANLVRKDALAWGITYIDLLEDKLWDIENRKWSIELYQQLSPWHIEHYPDGLARKMSIMKPTQVGISTLAVVKALHFADNWPVRVGYTLPRQQDTIDFVTTRVDPMLSLSPHLREKIGQPDSAHAKRLGNSYLFFLEMSTEPRMMPLDALFVDEIDLSDSGNLATAINRMDASRWKIQINLSTPTLANYGIHNLYNHSDMRQWLMKCPTCGLEQELEWDKNLKIVGPQNNPIKVFYGCAACSKEFSSVDIQSGRWVAQHPSRSSEHIGYHISQLMTSPAHTLYANYRDPQTTTLEFYRKRLGMPYELGGGSLTRDDILVSCFHEPYDQEPGWDGESTYYLGADQGNEIQVLIAKIEKLSRIPKIVHMELIPMDKGFDRLAQLINLFRVRRAVVDANPNRHDATKLTDSFPGRVLIADYTEQRDAWRATKNKKKYLTNVTANRTSMFDKLMKSIKDGDWMLFGNPSNLSPATEQIIDHVTALKRDVESRRMASGEIQVPVYRKLRADHLAHAWLYLDLAISVDSGRGSRIAVIDMEDEQSNDDRNDELENLIQDVSLLAEVPKEQLQTFVNKGNDDYDLPFPLSYKLGKVKERYNNQEEYIKAAIKASNKLLYS